MLVHFGLLLAATLAKLASTISSKAILSSSSSHLASQHVAGVRFHARDTWRVGVIDGVSDAENERSLVDPVVKTLRPFHIKNKRSGMCLEMLERNENDGKVRLRDCDKLNKNQHWKYFEHIGQISNMHGICLGAPEQNMIGSQVLVKGCDSTNLNQQWTYKGDTGQIESRQGLCLDSTFQRNTSNNKIQIWKCDTGIVNNQWNFLELAFVKSLKTVSPGIQIRPVDRQAFKYFRFYPTKVRNESAPHAVHLSEILLAGPDGYGLNIYEERGSASSPNGVNPLGEEADKAIDGNLLTKWTNLVLQPLVLSFPEPGFIATAFTFITATDSPERDPLQWEFHGSNDKIFWTILHSTLGVDANITLNRSRQNPWFILAPFEAPSTTLTITTTSSSTTWSSETWTSVTGSTLTGTSTTTITNTTTTMTSMTTTYTVSSITTSVTSRTTQTKTSTTTLTSFTSVTGTTSTTATHTTITRTETTLTTTVSSSTTTTGTSLTPTTTTLTLTGTSTTLTTKTTSTITVTTITTATTSTKTYARDATNWGA